MIQRHTNMHVNRVRARRTAGQHAAWPWRLATDSWIGSSDEQLRQRPAVPALDRFEDGSWIHRRHAD
jgi:hypothetical protein